MSDFVHPDPPLYHYILPLVMQTVTVMLIVQVMVSATECVSVIALVLSLSCSHGDSLYFVHHGWCVLGAWESEIWIWSVSDGGGA